MAFAPTGVGNLDDHLAVFAGEAGGNHIVFGLSFADSNALFTSTGSVGLFS